MKEPTLDTENTPPWPPRQPGHERRPHPGEARGHPPQAQQRQATRADGGKSGGAEGNERLTTLTGAVLLLLLAAEGVTILRLGRLLTAHFFIGMLLLGPVALKAGSTVYRFTRYYTGSAPYQRKGPPAPLLRLLGPIIIATTAAVFGTGIALAVTGPAGRPTWLFLHKGSFIIWFCAMTVHVLAYLPRLGRVLAAESLSGRRVGVHTDYTARTAAVVGGRGLRLFLVAASLLAGLVIAVLTVHLAAPWHLARFH
ncbi:MAG: hypothetical protein ABSA02_10195 [Trebonia sp.]|jgi:hypothetical protein